MLDKPGIGHWATGILSGGLVAGVLDIVYAMVSAALRGRSPVRSVQAVASGVLGASAFEGGAATAALGLALHFLIALTAAALYFAVSRRVGWLREKVLLPGALFGILVYLVMNFVVLPLSTVPFKLSYPPRALALGFISHALLVGLPIAFFTRRAPERRASLEGVP